MKGQSLRISVVIPAYNAEPYLEECVNSVLSQTHPVLEVLIIDDGSTDRTPIIAGSFGSPVRLLQQKQGGPARARNLGVKESHGDWIAFLDADDFWLPEKIEMQVHALTTNPSAILCYTALLILRLDGTRVAIPAPELSYVDSMLSLTNVGIPPSAVLLSRDTLLQVGGFSEIQRGCEDWELWFRLRKLGQFCAVPHAVTVYRESLGGLSSNAERMYEDFLRMLDRVLLADMHGWKRRLWRRRIMSYQQYKAAMTARHADQPNVERKFLAASLRTWPSPFWHPERFAASLVSARRSLQR